MTHKSHKVKSPWTLGQDRQRNESNFPVQPWFLVFAHSFLVGCVLSIYLFCILTHDGTSAVIWLEPSLLGYSLYTILSVVNLLLLVLLIGTALLFPMSWRGRRDWARIVTLVLAFLLLAATQAVANGWRTYATDQLEFFLEMRHETELRVHAIEQELAGLEDHPWAGEYLRQFRDPMMGEMRYWLAPEAGYAVAWNKPGFEEEARDADKAIHSAFWGGELRAEGAGVRLLVDSRFSGYLYIPATWGERRYLVEANFVDEFLSRASEIIEGAESDVHMDVGALLREGDQEKPVFSEPSFAEDD